MTHQVDFNEYVPQVERWVAVTERVRVFEDEYLGRLVLCPRSVLCRVLCRTAQTLRRWQDEGRFPRPEIDLGDGRDWYTEQQVRMVARHMLTYLGDCPTSTVNAHYNQERDLFFAAVRRDWSEGLDPE